VVDPTRKALDIIRDEHRSLASVLHALQYLSRDARDKGEAPNFGLLRLIVDYIDSFHQRFHHPKEDEYLFRAIRARSSEGSALLDDLERQHVQGDERISDMREALNHFQVSGTAGAARFAQVVDDYANFHWVHMRAEEDQIMPLAQRVLTDADWQTIDAAFTANEDPMFGREPQEDYALLFKLIVNMAPAPIGLGDRSH